MPLRSIASARPGFIRAFFPALFAAASLPAFLFQAVPGVNRAVSVAPGVVVRTANRGLATVRVIDVDLAKPGVRVGIAAEEIAVREKRITGRARTVPDWLRRTGAVAGVNGGFFGATVGEEFKEIVGLLKLDGRVRSAAPVLRSRSTGKRYARSAFGVASSGTPRIDWVTSRPGSPQLLRLHTTAEFTQPGPAWAVREAVACGPRLIRAGRIEVADRAERLVSRGALPRTFLGYAERDGKPRHLVLCATEGMEFADCARFLADYFRRYHKLPCREAMALDGGGSTQAAWREGGAVRSGPGTSVTVPTAVLVYHR